MSIPKVLSIAGVDPSGGAGVLADVKTFSALGAYGMAVITALTAQSTRGVTGVHAVPTGFIAEQVDTLLDDITPDAVKIGMLATSEVAATVGAALPRLAADGCRHVVLDPVMVATSGDRLLDDDAVEAVRALLPQVSLITPNLPEAAVLLDRAEAATLEEMAEQACALHALGAPRVLVKAGHLGADDAATDILVIDGDVTELTASRVDTTNTHGTGCTLSSALAALRPQHPDWPSTARRAKQWLTAALRHGHALNVGHGHGPVHHFHELWSSDDLHR